MNNPSGLLPEMKASSTPLVSRRVVAIFGPTGVGKTAVAARVAAALGVSVISCDSMQLYRGFPVLANQPSAEDLALAPHALVGVVPPEGEWSALLYGEHARPLIELDLARRGRAVVAGGTGLYLRAALAPLAIPEVHDPARRADLMQRAETEGAAALHAELGRLDPGAAARIDPRNVRRTVRALEVVHVLGPGTWSGRQDLWRPSYRYPTAVVGLVLPREELYARIDRRARLMLEQGAVEEVRAHRSLLARRGCPPECATAVSGVAKAIGYREICRYLKGEADLDEVAERLAASTRRYARAQLTWLRKLEDAVIMDVSSGPDDAAARILALIENPEETWNLTGLAREDSEE